MRIISKEKPGRWKCQHSDGEVTYHKTLREAREHVHTMHVFLPWEACDPEDRRGEPC